MTNEINTDFTAQFAAEVARAEREHPWDGAEVFEDTKAAHAAEHINLFRLGELRGYNNTMDAIPPNFAVIVRAWQMERHDYGDCIVTQISCHDTEASE